MIIFGDILDQMHIRRKYNGGIITIPQFWEINTWLLIYNVVLFG